MADDRTDLRIGAREFVALSALMMSVFALSIDCVLPALSDIGRDLGIRHANNEQLVVTAMILGMALGQPFYGPLSDSIGRKPAIYAGLAVFAAGCLMSLFAQGFGVMLAGRFLQGVGAAAMRIVIVALIRDRVGGVAMARILSFVITVHMSVPIVAPFIGQGILLVAHWRVIFVFLLAAGLVMLTWFAIRQPETLPRERRMRFSLGPVAAAVAEVLRTRAALGYSAISAMVFGALGGHILSARQVFQDLYGVGAAFPIYFSSLGLAIAAAALLNARLVVRFGMQRLCWNGLAATTFLAAVYVGAAVLAGGKPPLWSHMTFLALALFCLGMLFGNFNALAMEPLGHVAGVAAGVIGTLGWLGASLLGTAIGQLYDGTVVPVAAGFLVSGAASIGVMFWVNRS